MSLPSIFEYLPEAASCLTKVAEEKREHPAKRVARVAGQGLLGFGGGMLAGVGVGHLADKWHQAAGGAPISQGFLQRALPAVGGAAGLAYNLYKAKELEELRRAVQPDITEGRVPGQ